MPAEGSSSNNEGDIKRQQSFIVEADELVAPGSPRPHHLQSRLDSKSVVDPVEQLQVAADKRMQLLDERKSRLSKQLEHVRAVVSRQHDRNEAARQRFTDGLQKADATATANRTRLLSTSSDTNARKVKRAKQVATQQVLEDKKHAESVKLALDERLAVSGLRRDLLLRTPRSRLADEMAMQVHLSRTKYAACRIQRAWRRQLLQQAILNWSAVPLSAQYAEMPFEVMAAEINKDTTIKAMENLLNRMKSCSAATRAKKYKGQTRIFLSAYIIVNHKTDIMPDAQDSAIQLQLVDAATELMTAFRHLSTDLSTLKRFTELWDKYHGTFDKWKLADTEKLVDSLHEHFEDLNKLWNSVRSQHGADDEWRVRIIQQQKQIQTRVQKIAGKSALSRFKAIDQQEYRNSDTSDASDAESVRGGRGHSRNTSSHRPLSQSRSGVSALQGVTSLLPSAQLTNEQMAHELILDPDFQLKPSDSEQSDLHKQVTLAAKNAFFDALRADMAAGKSEWALNVLEDIKQQLLSMLVEGGKIHRHVNEIIDMDLIRQEVAQNAFDLPKLVQFIVSMMLQLCAPIRDSSVQAVLATERNAVDQLRDILELLPLMKLDLANYRLQQLRPHLIDQAVQYEQDQFRDALAAGQLTLERTTTWLTDVARSIAADSSTLSLEHIYNEALMKLISQHERLSQEICPETLALDFERLCRMQNEAQCLTIVAALIMLSRNFTGGRMTADQTVALKESLMVLMRDDKTTTSHISTLLQQEVGAIIQFHDKSLLPEQATMIGTMVDKTLSLNDTVYQLLNRRLQTLIKLQMSTTRTRRDSNNTGLEPVLDEVNELVKRIKLLAEHNRRVYAPWYDAILQAAVS